MKGIRKPNKIKDAAKALKEKLNAVEEPLIMPGLKSQHQTLNYGIRLAGKLAALPPDHQQRRFRADAAGTRGVRAVVEQIDAQIDALNQVMESDVARFNDLIWAAEISPLVLKPKP